MKLNHLIKFNYSKSNNYMLPCHAGCGMLGIESQQVLPYKFLSWIPLILVPCAGLMYFMDGVDVNLRWGLASHYWLSLLASGILLWGVVFTKPLSWASLAVEISQHPGKFLWFWLLASVNESGSFHSCLPRKCSEVLGIFLRVTEHWLTILHHKCGRYYYELPRSSSKEKRMKMILASVQINSNK